MRMKTMSKNYTGLSALYDKLSKACKEVYEGNEFIDPSCGYEINDMGVFKLLEDGKITVDKLLDVCDVELRLWHAARERWRRAWSWAYIA